MIVQPETAGRLIFSIALVVVLYVAAAELRRLIRQRIAAPPARLSLSYVVNYVAVAIAVVLLATVWLEPLGGLSVAIGIVAAGAAFSLQEVVTSVAGWFLIISGQAFRVGDRIEMGGTRGDVIGYTLLRTTLLELDNWIQADQHTGRTVVVANSAILKQPLYNYTHYFHFTWDEIHVLVAASSNWRRAREICLDLIERRNGGILDALEQAGDVCLASQSFTVRGPVEPA